MSEVRIGWIVEGPTEERVLPDLLRRHLAARDSQLPVARVVGRIITAAGGKIRNPDWVKDQVMKLRRGAHTYVAVIADQERFPSASAPRELLRLSGAEGVYIASPKFERWLLADATAVQDVLGKPRAPNWRTMDPLKVLESLKAGYRKVRDGTLLGERSSAIAWATEEPEFCSLLRQVESWLGLEPTACTEAPWSVRPERGPAHRRRGR